MEHKVRWKRPSSSGVYNKQQMAHLNTELLRFDIVDEEGEAFLPRRVFRCVHHLRKETTLIWHDEETQASTVLSPQQLTWLFQVHCTISCIFTQPDTT